MNTVLLRLQACAQAFELRKDVPHPMRFFTTLAEFVNHLVIDHVLGLDKMRKGLGRADRIDWDALVRDHGSLGSVLSLGATPLPRGHGVLVGP